MAVFASERANANIYPELLRQHVVLMKNTPFGGFSAGLRHLNPLAAVAEILIFGGLAAVIAKLEFAGLLNRQRFAAKRPGYASR
jgi:hypothetical protein